MIRNLFSSLRVRLILFVLLAALPALGLTLYTGLEQRKQAAAEAQADALSLVHFVTGNHELIIENTRGFLIALSHSFSSRYGQLDQCGEVFSHLLETHFPYYSAFYIADLNANILCSMKTGDTPDDLGTCEHYQNLIHAQGFVTSQYHICHNTGKGVIAIGYPVRDKNDQVEGVINVSLDLAWFNQMASDAHMPPGSTLTVIDKNGSILAHYPDPENWVGKLMPENPVMNVILSQKEGTTQGLGTDNQPRLFAFTPIRGTDDSVFVSIGIPENVAFAEVNQTTTRNLILLGIVTILALGAAWFLGEVFVLRQTKTLMTTTERLAAGDLSARTEIAHLPGEIGQLARAFDEMAESLAQREEERSQAERSMKEYAANLERSNRDLQDFANIASHDLQEPLRKIQVFSDLLQMRYSESLDERGQEYLVRMQDAARRMQSLIQDLLTYSRISTRGQPFAAVDLNQVIGEVLSDLVLPIEQSAARVNVEPLATIEADATQMHQLLQNLISNALKFHKHGQPPLVSIRSKILESPGAPGNGSSADQRTCQIEISDNGIGFDDKYLDRIFLPFERLHGHSEYQGTGMGLAICRKIVERHDGSISAQSSPNQGATFIVRLPVRNRQGVEEHEPKTDHHPAG